MFRGAVRSDLEQILQIYAHARQRMAETGNPTQWANGYPTRELLEEDIDSNRLFVYMINGQMQAVFAFILGADPTYALRTASGSTTRCLTAPFTGWHPQAGAKGWPQRSSSGVWSTAKACGPIPMRTTRSCSICWKRMALPVAASSMWPMARPASLTSAWH